MFSSALDDTTSLGGALNVAINDSSCFMMMEYHPKMMMYLIFLLYRKTLHHSAELGSGMLQLMNTSVKITEFFNIVDFHSRFRLHFC